MYQYDFSPLFTPRNMLWIFVRIVETYAVDICKNRLGEAILTNIHNMFLGVLKYNILKLF